MKKNTSKINIIIISVIVIIALATTVYGLVSRGGKKAASVPAASPSAAVTPADDSTAENTEAADTFAMLQEYAENAAKAYLEEFPAESYLLVTTGSGIYTPVPLNEENSLTITQEDGSENVIHVGKNSFYMESSNCDNQNCVGEGEVTLENMNTRILFNLVICLPHNLSLEMLTPEEALENMTEMYIQEILYRAQAAAESGAMPQS